MKKGKNVLLVSRKKGKKRKKKTKSESVRSGHRRVTKGKRGRGGEKKRGGGFCKQKEN